MKKMLSDYEGYQVFAEVKKIDHLNKNAVIFYTKWLSSKNPDEFHKKFEMYLSDEELASFKNTLC